MSRLSKPLLSWLRQLLREQNYHHCIANWDFSSLLNGRADLVVVFALIRKKQELQIDGLDQSDDTSCQLVADEFMVG